MKPILSSILGIAFLLLIPAVSAAQSQILSVTPPLYQLSALPGDVWQSSLKVVNGSTYPITVYAEVVNFVPSGEAGHGKFVPIRADETAARATVAEWIEIVRGPHVISEEGSKDIPFFVEIPEDAAPGGHYAAILVTTQPPTTGDGAMAVQTSQAVTSLFFVRVEGDVHEEGSIREFRAIDQFLERPETEFSLRFENKGNVHLQPKGDIVITNMWGTVRGTIPVNYQTHFGNVLPQSIRDFKFAWQSDFSMADIGRYKAVATLAYGEDGIKNITSTAYFWVIPLKATLITLLIVSVCIAFIVWMVKAYIRRMLALAGVEVEKTVETVAAPVVPRKHAEYRRVSAPIQNGVLDLRTRLNTAEAPKDVAATLASFIIAYKTFFISILFLAVMVVAMIAYMEKATEEHDRYSVTIDEGEGATTLQGSDIHEKVTE